MIRFNRCRRNIKRCCACRNSVSDRAAAASDNLYVSHRIECFRKTSFNISRAIPVRGGGILVCAFDQSLLSASQQTSRTDTNNIRTKRTICGGEAALDAFAPLDRPNCTCCWPAVDLVLLLFKCATARIRILFETTECDLCTRPAPDRLNIRTQNHHNHDNTIRIWSYTDKCARFYPHNYRQNLHTNSV